MDRPLHERPAEPGLLIWTAAYSPLSDAQFVVRLAVQILSLEEDLGREFTCALRKFKLLCGARPVYADTSSAGLVTQLSLIRALCLGFGRNLLGRIEKRLARHQMSVEIGQRVAYRPRTFRFGLI